MRKYTVAGVALLAMGVPEVMAQGSAPQVPLGSAKLQAVTGDGVFDLREGKSVDLTKQQLLLTFKPNQRRETLEASRIDVMLAGSFIAMTPGQRVNLKTFPASAKELKDKDKCFLDLIEVVAPKGAPATATLRFSCL